MTPGSRLGAYEITGKLGEGGMGEVYRATDSNLRREVAIKVLPAAFTADKERLARFEREAQLLAQLNHPNIAQIYGLEASGETRALVMELVPGATLAERLEAGPMSVPESLACALDVARALEEAHEKGIVHRDLKPQNIKAPLDGKVKVLDFGLAKAMDAASGSPSAADLGRSPTLMNSPTMTAAGTQLGVILGTAAYMAPEQARGGAVDKRADIWAFGVVLHEMLTGHSLFAGPTVSDTLAGVLKTEIDWKALPAETPPAIRRLLRRCLERNPKNRLHDIADARIVLDDLLAGRADEGTPVVAATAAIAPPSLARRALPWIAGIALGAGIAALAGRVMKDPAPVEPPRVVSLTYSGREFSPTASPDGRTIAFASTRDGRSRIWLKQLATGEEVAITAGPADAWPAFSPDGSTILFLRGAGIPYGLFRVPVVGGEPRRIADEVGGPAAWSPDGKRIAILRSSKASGFPDTLVTISADGADVRELARTPDHFVVSLRWSPDGGAIGAWEQLSTNFAAQQSIAEFDVATGKRRVMYEPPASVLLNGWSWSGSDALLVVEATTQSGRGGTRLRRVARNGGPPVTLLSLQRPSGTLDVVGPGRIVIDQLEARQNLGEYLLAPVGAPAQASAPARWLTGGASVDRQPHAAPDGSRVIFNSDRGGNLDVWELELASGAVRRLTDAASDDWDPGLSRDGRQLLWTSNRSGNFEIWSAASDGAGARKVTDDGVDAENPTATPDGAWIVYSSANPKHAGIWKVRADGTEAQQVAAGPLGLPEISPDGRWISSIHLQRNAIVIYALADGAELLSIPMPSNPSGAQQVGRSRWIPGSSTLLWLGFDTAAATTNLTAQEIAPGRDTTSTRRTVLVGAVDAMPESFAVTSDGARLVVSVNQSRADLLLIEGLPGVTR